MKRFLTAAAAAVAFAGVAVAQTSTTTTTTTTTTITPDQETAIRTYVTRQRPATVAVPSGFTVAPGAVLPTEVEISTLPADVGVTGYSYATLGGRTVVVGSDRKIIRIID